MKLYPLNDKVIIERIELEKKSPGGIMLNSSSLEKSNKGKILAVGKGRTLENGKVKPIEININDIVIFNEGYGIKTEKIKNKEILIVPENDILAIIKE